MHVHCEFVLTFLVVSSLEPCRAPGCISSMSYFQTYHTTLVILSVLEYRKKFGLRSKFLPAPVTVSTYLKKFPLSLCQLGCEWKPPP